MATTRYQIQHTRAGAFKKGDVVTREQIVKAGADFDFFHEIGAIKPVSILNDGGAAAEAIQAEITAPRLAAQAAQEAAAAENEAAAKLAAAARVANSQTGAAKAAADKEAAGS